MAVSGFGERIERIEGSAFVSNVPAGGTAQASIRWNTLGFTGDVPMRVVVDPFNRVAETDETNNETTTSITILTRPDMRISNLQLSNPEPVVGEPITVTLTLNNAGQTAAATSILALYDGNPDTGGTLVGEGTPAVAGESEATLTFTWTPSTPGPHRLFAVSDRDNAVNEFDEGNNQTWRDVYVGFKGPILLDSGGSNDPTYTAALGYGVVDEGQPDILGDCGSEPEPYQTYRLDPGGRVVYRFDHLLPGHFYHLDLTLYECDGLGRRESILVDGFEITDQSENLSDGEVHELLIRLDPALYADRTITVSIKQAQGYDHTLDLAASGLPPVEKVLASIAGTYDRLLCEEGTYRPLPANPVFNTCHTMQPGRGYLIYMTGPATLVIRGTWVAADTPLELHQGWNWIGYLPQCALPVETALASIDGQFDLLHGEDGTFQPPAGNPAHTLHQMGPGRGYMIRMTTAARLKYPAAACGAAAQTFRVSETRKVSSSACAAVPTPYFTVFYGTALLGSARTHRARASRH